MNLLTTAEASILLALSEKSTRNLLKELGVQPFSLGGRRGLRWYKEEILEAIESTRRGKTPPPESRRTRKIPTTWDKPVAEIMAELLSGQHGRKEKT